MTNKRTAVAAVSLLAVLGVGTAAAQSLTSSSQPSTPTSTRIDYDYSGGPETVHNPDGTVKCIAPKGMCQQMAERESRVSSSDPNDPMTVMGSPTSKPGYKEQFLRDGTFVQWVPESWPSMIGPSVP